MSAPLVIVQFSVGNPDRLPKALPVQKPETRKESQSRRARNETSALSNQLVEATRMCSVAELLDELNDAGYYLVSAYALPRRDRRNPGRLYYSARYTFAEGEAAAEKLDSIRDHYGEVEDDLLDLFHNVFWQVRAYRNVREEDGAVMVSINLDGAEPRFRNDGSEVLVWQKDAAGHRVGTAPVPLQPQAALHFDESYAVSVAAS